VLSTVVPQLAQGLLADWKDRLGLGLAASEQERAELFQATLAVLYRLLFLLYTEGRDLLPIREPP
jgi:hypothetical protein